MNEKIKAFIIGVIFLAILSGGAFFYGNLTKKNTPKVELKTNNTEGQIVSKEEKAAVSGAGKKAEEEKYKAIDVKLYNAEGDSVMLSEYYGKPLVLNFWASWCPPCKEEMPDFNSVYLEMKEDVNFLMINMTDGERETQESAEKYLSEKDFSFPVLFDKDIDAATNYQIVSLPTTIFIDKDGYMITGAKGQISEEILRKGIGMITEVE